MRTYITIHNVNKELHNRIESWVNKEGEEDYGGGDFNIPRIFSDLYDMEFIPEEHLNRVWLDNNIGSKWISFEIDYMDDDEIKINTETAWSVPFNFLERLSKKITNHDTFISGVFEDESFDPCGAFCYGVDDYHDVEELEEGEIDFERLWDDEDYYQQVIEYLIELQNKMIVWYRVFQKDSEQSEDELTNSTLSTDPDDITFDSGSNT